MNKLNEKILEDLIVEKLVEPSLRDQAALSSTIKFNSTILGFLSNTISRSGLHAVDLFKG